MSHNVLHSKTVGEALLGRIEVDQHLSFLLVGPDDESRRGLRDQLQDPRWKVREARSGSDALERLLEEGSEVMLLDPKLPDLDTVEFQAIVRSQHPHTQIILMSSSLEKGSAPALSSPPGGRVTSQFQRTRSSFQAESGESAQSGWQNMIGSTPAMQRVFRAARLAARHDTTVLVQGESGTGKDLIARGIHASGNRARQPFVVINCAAIPESLLESELFGYAKGSFTGAAQSRVGRIQAAHGGTLFLDEIGDMPYPLQSKLLRFLEQREIQRIGETETLRVDCRIIAATNADLKHRISTNQFREDLFYRLAIFPIHLPPLRERREDLIPLMQRFLATFSPGLRLSEHALDPLLSHLWPGNIRELRNVLERACLFAEGRNEILPEDITL